MIILGTNSIKDTGFDVDNSCRFNSTSSDKLTRTFGSGGSVVKWTYSTWFKISYIGGNEQVFFSSFDNGDNYSYIKINGNNKLEFRAEASGSDVLRYTLTRRFHDPSAFMHLVVALDSSLGTAGDRIKIWINGVRETVFDASTAPSQDATTLINSAAAHEIGHAGDGSDFFNGYMSQVGFINNAQYDADQFGEFDEDSGIWKPIDISGLTFGQTSFFLDFADSADLGDDESGNSNDWTEVNLAAIDQSTDTCTNNWCVQNSIATPISGSPTFSQGNLTIASGSGWKSTIGTFALTKGKWYWETKGGGSAGTILNGIASTAVIEAGGASNGVNNNATIGVNLPAYAYHGSSGAMYRSDTTGNGLDQGGGSWGTAYNTGDLISVYLDLDNYKLYTAKNDAMNVSGTGYSIASGYAYYPLCVPYTNTINLNYGIGAFGATAVSSAVADANGYGAFEYDPSRGGSSDFDSTAKDFLAICTKNLAEYG